jgi:hypothetical protein
MLDRLLLLRLADLYSLVQSKGSRSSWTQMLVYLPSASSLDPDLLFSVVKTGLEDTEGNKSEMANLDECLHFLAATFVIFQCLWLPLSLHPFGLL